MWIRLIWLIIYLSQGFVRAQFICMENEVNDNSITVNCTVNKFLSNIDLKFPNNTGGAFCSVRGPENSDPHCDCECNLTIPGNCTITQDFETKTTTIQIRNTSFTGIFGWYTCKHGSYEKSIMVARHVAYRLDDADKIVCETKYFYGSIVMMTIGLASTMWGCFYSKIPSERSHCTGVSSYRNELTELPMNDHAGAIELDGIGTDTIRTNVGQIETETNVDVAQPETSSVTQRNQSKSQNGHLQSVENVTPRKRKQGALSFSQTLCDKCIEIPVCTVCINCRELYCKSCCDVHTESEKDHTILHIPHVAAENQEIKCGKCKNKTAEQLCTICLNLMCETCAESHEHEGNEGIRMMIIYHGHPKLLRQTSEEKLNFFRDLSIEKRRERYPIRICGISYIADGRLILVDKRNRNLLVFQSKEEKNRLHLKDEPHALTSMTGQHIAITFPFEMEIRIYQISENSIDKLNIICLPSLNLHNFKPYSIAYDNDVFVVEVGKGDDGKIIIMNDTKLHYEIPNKNRAYFTGNTIRLALEVKNQNPLEGRVFVSALSKNVVFCVDFKGNDIWKVSIPSPRGISVVPEDCIPRNNLVICSRRCNTIFGLNKENGSDKQILLSEGKIKFPRYITCNNKDRLLCIQLGTEDDKDVEETVSCVEVRAPPSN